MDGLEEVDNSPAVNVIDVSSDDSDTVTYELSNPPSAAEDVALLVSEATAQVRHSVA